MDSVDPAAYLSQLGSQKSTPAAPSDIDAQILKLAGTAAPVSPAAPQGPDPAIRTAAEGVMPAAGQGVLGRTAGWLKNAPVVAGGELYRMAQSLRGKPLDPYQSAVLGVGEQRAPGAATLTDIAATAPATMAAGEVLPALGLSRLASPVVKSVLQGGTQGLLTADPGEHLQNAALGAAAGGLLSGAGTLGGKVVRGLSRTPQAQTLINNNIDVTPGLLNPKGPANFFEQAAQHLPFVGSRISNARAAVPAQLTQRMLSDAAAPGDQVVAGSLGDQVAGLKSGFDAAYDNAVGGYPAKASIMRVKGADIPLSDAFDDVINKARPGLTPGGSASLGANLQGQLQTLLKSGVQSGKGLQATDLQQMRSTLRQLAREAPGEGQTAEATRSFWQDAEDKVTQALESQLPPKAAAALRATDAQFGKFATVRDLAASVKDRTPTLNDWSTAIRQSTPKNVYAQGGGWNRDLVQAAAQVAKPTVAHTGALGAGTIAPIMHGAAGLLGGAGAYGLAEHPEMLKSHPLLAASLPVGLGLLAGAYSPGGMRALAGQTGMQRAITGLLNSNPRKFEALSLLGRSGALGGLLGSEPATQ